MTTITVTKDIKKSGNYNSVGVGISITTEVPEGGLITHEANELYQIANLAIKEQMDKLPPEQSELIAIKRVDVDTQGYK
jgi:hypothetical protein